MKILCFGYREWALKIYRQLAEYYPDKSFIVISGNKITALTQITEAIQPDIVLFYGWSDYIPESVYSKWECLMLHPSCLPKYRGGSPIQNQIQDGVIKSCISIFKISKGIDAGKLYGQSPLSLRGDLDEIFERMIDIGFQLTCNILENNYTITEQDDSKATYCKRRKPSESEVTINDLQHMSAQQLYDKVRMLNSDTYPRVFIKMNCGNKVFFNKVSLQS